MRRAFAVVAAIVTAIGVGGVASAASGWTSVTAPNPTGNVENSLQSVSCPTSDFCMAVGTGAVNPGDIKTIAETFNGKVWSLAPPKQASDDVDLVAVDCLSAQDCTAVGSNGENGLAERWNGRGWRVEKTIATRYGGWLSGVSCATAQSCVAVGTQYTSKQHLYMRALAERWTRRGWSATSTPSLSPYQDAGLASVSCVSSTHCVAAGGKIRYISGDGFYNVVETWNGTKWAVNRVPSPAGITSLSAITCRTTTWCLAVGKAGNAAGEPATLELRGSSWTDHTVPVTGGQFSAVACRSTRSCIAAGIITTNTTQLPVIEHWNGSSWAKRTIAEPDSQGSQLNGVSCSTASSCFAVGEYTPASAGSSTDYHVLVEHGTSR